jgi:oligopeptidase A
VASSPYLQDDFFIRWSSLQPRDVQPDIGQALEAAQARVDEIASIPPEQTTFENTFLALEQATERLGVAWGLVSHLSSVADSPELRDAHNAMLPRVSEFNSRIPLNAKLWSALKSFASKPEAQQLTGSRKRLLDETVADFRQHGADLPADKKSRLEALQAELAQLTQKFSENVLDSTNAWELVVEDESKLDGLPEFAKQAARAAAEKKGLGTKERPVWRFTLHQPSLEPFMTYLHDDGLRRQMWEGSINTGRAAPYDNTELLLRILELRRERADLLGKAHFPDLVLERRMAKTGQRAIGFIEDLYRRISPAVEREATELEQFKAAKTGRPAEPLEPWELGYWAEKLRKERYDFDEEQLRPYFPLDRVQAGLFEILERVFGARVQERPRGSAEGWHEEVRVYDLIDLDGRALGSFYTDWHPRESKRSGAWMNYLRTGEQAAGGQRQPHLGLVCGNLTPPLNGRPALLNHREVETIFHEFGHLIHHLFGEVEVKSLNGVNVAWDFVELPSQIMENWCWERESLDLFARHWETGEPIPEELFQKMRAARNFRSATVTMRQLSLGKLDMAMHLNPEAFLGSPEELDAKLRQALAGYLPRTKTPAPTIARRFTHVFGDPVGYAAGYYSYKWAEVLDADAFTRFRREGLFNQQVGREFRQRVLSRGNAEDPMELYRSFMGREPQLEALLERSGLIPSAA